MQEENQRKMFIDFIKESKNSQLAKMNSSTFKSGTLLLFLLSSTIWFINNLPSSKATPQDIFVFFIFCNFLIGTTIVISNIINSLFRKKSVRHNILGKYNKLQKQYMLPVLISILIQGLFWIGILVAMFILMIKLNYQYYYIVVPFFFYFLMAVLLNINTAIALVHNYSKLKITLPDSN